MRNRIWIPCAIILAICILLLLRRTTDDNPPPTPGEKTEATHRAEGREASRTRPESQARLSSDGSVPSQGTNSAKSKINPEVLALWQAPIDFYGKAVDESGNPVEGAKVSFSWDETPAENSERTLTTESDANGLFALEGKRGRSLEIAVSKEGYYASRGGREILEYWAFNQDRHHANDVHNPMIFSLRKKGVGELLIAKDYPPGIGQIAQLRGDGTPLRFDLTSGQTGTGGSGELELRFWRGEADKANRRFGWACQVSVLGGGLIATDQEFAFEAPREGYEPSLRIDMPSTDDEWRNELHGKYYVRLPDGKYARIELHLLARNGAFTMKSAVNPTGSRNLEPLEEKPRLRMAPGTTQGQAQ